jgi:acetylornithine deacetylase/succinyl-diaminopimelate desuccinylase-like protein
MTACRFRVASLLLTLCVVDWNVVAGARRVPEPAVDLLLADKAVASARKAIREMETATIDTQIAVCEVPAPPFGEAARARLMKGHFERAGLTAVRIDQEGNVLGERPGRESGSRVVVSAHLDTVFPKGTDVRVTRKGNVLAGPGIGDDCRGLAVLLAVARTLQAHPIPTDRPVLFVATVGEEGLGDLRGVRHLFEGPLKGQIGQFLSFDGDGLGIVSKGVGSLRYRVTFSGPGGHSWGSFGMANPIHALGRAVSGIAALQVPANPKTTFNVGRIGGGTSVNSIASSAWMEVDLRSTSQDELDGVDRRFRAVVDSAVSDENQRWNGRGAVTAKVDRTGFRPTGETPSDSMLLRRVVALTDALGGRVSPSAGSTDANMAMSVGIPALTLGSGGSGRGAHSPGETFDTTGSAAGTERALLAVLAAATGEP